MNHRTEIPGGITTFFAVSHIMIVNPAILFRARAAAEALWRRAAT